MKKVLCSLVFFLFALGASAQTTTVSATITDSDGQTWNNGKWNVVFTPNPAYPNLGSYNISGTPLDQSVTTQNGVLNGAGQLSLNVYQNGVITPSGSTWTLTVCPNATAKCTPYNFSTGLLGTLNLSSILSSLVIAPRFLAVSGTYGYLDVEASLQLVPGSTYFNVTSSCQRVWNGTAWIDCAANGIINVLGYGAQCNGVTDDTAAFALAMAALPANGGTVFVPSKTCVAHVVMVPWATLTGYGATIKSPSGTSPVITAAADTFIFGINIIGFGSGVSDIGVYIPVSALRVVARDVFAQNVGEEGMNIQGAAAKIDNFLAFNTALNHIADLSGKHCAVLINSTDEVFENSEVGTSVQTYGFNANLVRGAMCVTSSNNFIGPNNQFEISDFGVYDFGFWNKYIGNRADLNGGPGFIAAGVGSYYIGNHSHNNSLALTNTYDDFIATGTNNNNFLGNLAANTTHLCLTGGTPCYTRYAFNNDTGFHNNWSQDKTQWPGGTTTALWNGGTGTSSSFSQGAGASSGFLVTTAATSDTVTIAGVGPIGICTISPTNTSAATNIATTYISAKTDHQITVTHVATANMLYNILCTTN